MKITSAIPKLYVMALLLAVPAHASTTSTAYTYDGRGRLVTALYGNGLCIVYVYDAAGNVEERRIQTGSVTGAQWGIIPYGCFRWSP